MRLFVVSRYVEIMARNRHFFRWLVGFVVITSACSALTPDNPAATLQAQREGFIAEATSIAQAAQAQGTQVVGTAVAAQTYVALMEGRNQLLLATMQVVFPPTQALVVNNGTSTPGQMASPAPDGSIAQVTTGPTQVIQGTPDAPASLDGAQFAQVGTASNVRNSDGCAESLVNSFPADVQRIYITARALNIQQGTDMRVEWYYQGQLTYTESFTVPRDDDDFCLWFFLAPTDVTLSPGNWSVQLFANNTAVAASPVNFTVG